MNISKHITYYEATASETAKSDGIINQPTPEIMANMQAVANECFEPLREWYGKPIAVNSFYRCEALNKAVGGSATSQHVKGEAIDMDAGSKEENRKLYDWAKNNLIFDQLINEYDYSWVHISFKKGMNRNMAFAVK